MRFADALAAPGFGAVAEFKRRSPSGGDLRPHGDVAATARAYESAGARAMSVLVDERFAGSWDDLRSARAAATLPLLAKGFFSTPAHLREARDAGADAVLLLLRDLDDTRCAELLAEAAALGLDTLVEAHDGDELDRAVQLGAPVIGINARNLADFSIDRDTQLELVARAPRDRVVVAESGIFTRAQAAAAELSGANAALVGSALMTAPDPGAKLRDLFARPLVKICGLTRQIDVDAAVDAGADLVGFILAKESPRRAAGLLDAPPTVLRVAVFVGETAETDADLVQFYGREDGHRTRDAVLLRGDAHVGSVVDLPWAETDPRHLDRARATNGRVMLAGGLGPDNVRAAIETVQPWAVDSARSTESSPGVKDHDAVRAWVKAASGVGSTEPDKSGGAGSAGVGAGAA
ncbi:MAG TPA: bifunctional indole-3-glycerol phosphate synthase/phosphoribosylanthranilate isomerase [Gaiellaceae bacterium]|nr:bifunctional indole-3-glycerol phosphate synthase/phosphoribosylanthranilate isomerase [Gaiellaceae bacterium]